MRLMDWSGGNLLCCCGLTTTNTLPHGKWPSLFQSRLCGRTLPFTVRKPPRLVANDASCRSVVGACSKTFIIASVMVQLSHPCKGTDCATALWNKLLQRWEAPSFSGTLDTIAHRACSFFKQQCLCNGSSPV